MQLLRGEKDENGSCYVANIIDRTSTEVGRVTLRSWIAQPTDDVNILQQRQAHAQFLLNNTELFSRLDQQLEKFKTSENFLLSFWVNDPLKQASERNYFKLSRFKTLENFLNGSTTCLTGSVIFENQRRIVSFLTIGLAALMLPNYGVSRLISQPTTNGLDRLAERLVGSGGPIFGLLSFIENQYIQSAGFITAGVYCGFLAQDEYNWARDGFTLTMCLQTKLHHVANCIHAIQEIGSVLQDYPELSCALGKHLANPETEKLFNLLDSATFKGESSMFANYGAILVAYKLLHEHAADLEPLLCAVGELDAYMSIARLVKEFQEQRVHITFAEYCTNSDSPEIIFQDLWSPFIDPVYVVANSIELGQTRNLIITGPNEGGKSTFVKSVAIGIILAQSIGIVPARQAIITPFSYIATYLNITDDHGKSLFEAQVQRAKHILDHIDNMQKNKFTFVIIDELFNGTDARVGQAASFSIADYLSKNPQVISIFPTHFPELTDLEKSGRSVNYRVSATIDEDGKISYPFVLEKGASHQNIVLDIMRNEGFNSSIIDQASQLLKPVI